MVDALHPPPEVIASFPKPNFIDPKTHGPGLVVMSILFTCVGFFVVAARFYSRVVITKCLGTDDWLILVSFLLGIALTVLVIIGNDNYYNDRHVWDIPLTSAVGHRANVWISQICYTAALSSIKISVLLFYRRLSVSFTKWFLLAIWIGVIYNILYLTGFTLALILVCSPTEAYWLSWDRTWVTVNRFQCGSEQIGQPLSAMFSVIGDVYSAILPMILISRVRMHRRQKKALYLLFSLAFLAIIAGMVRGVYIYRVVNVDYDFTWTLWKVWVWGEIELWCALCAASAPALKPFFKHFLTWSPRFAWMSTSHGDQSRVYVVRSDSRGGMRRAEIFYNDRHQPNFHGSRGGKPLPDAKNTLKSKCDNIHNFDDIADSVRSITKQGRAPCPAFPSPETCHRNSDKCRRFQISNPIQVPILIAQRRSSKLYTSDDRITTAQSDSGDRNQDLEMCRVNVVTRMDYLKALPPLPEND